MNLGNIVCSKYKIEEKLLENEFFQTFIISSTIGLEGLFKMTVLPNQSLEFKKELFILNEISISCPYIVGFKEIFEEKEKLCLVSYSFLGVPNLRMELDEKRRSRVTFSQEDVFQLLFQLCTVLNLLHKKGLVHGCVSPDNILVMNGVFCLIDYGISKFVDRTKNSTWNIVFEEYEFLFYI
jgi:serine/threonine protein kinase